VKPGGVFIHTNSAVLPNEQPVENPEFSVKKMWKFFGQIGLQKSEIGFSFA
jgi:hypothetical protein